MTQQTEKSYLKQPTVYMNKKTLSAERLKKGFRYYRNIGLGFKTPKEAITGHYIDKKCPFTGEVAIRGRVFK